MIVNIALHIIPDLFGKNQPTKKNWFSPHMYSLQCVWIWFTKSRLRYEYSQRRIYWGFAQINSAYFNCVAGIFVYVCVNAFVCTPLSAPRRDLPRVGCELEGCVTLPSFPFRVQRTAVNQPAQYLKTSNSFLSTISKFTSMILIADTRGYCNE